MHTFLLEHFSSRQGCSVCRSLSKAHQASTLVFLQPFILTAHVQEAAGKCCIDQLEKNFLLKKMKIPASEGKKLTLSVADAQQRCRESSRARSPAGLNWVGSCAELATAKWASWQAGMCHGGTAGFNCCAEQDWETGYVLGWEQERRSATTPPFTSWELDPRWSCFPKIHTQFLEVRMHASLTSNDLSVFSSYRASIW